MIVTSPVVENGKVSLLKKIKCSSIIIAYKKVLNIDVSHFFNDLEYVDLYQCEKSGYRFFYPFRTLGDSSFYEQVEAFDWYYMPWKWEHDISLKLINKKDTILEIGSGGLGFIQKLSELGYKISGLELNKKSIIKAVNLGLDVKPLFIEDFASSHPAHFDVVCSFQVLEHISNIKSFIGASVKALRSGGKLIICVPNNDSFIKLDNLHLMNFPPHHAGWWNLPSLQKLQEYFPIKLESTYYEPLQSYHINWYVDLKLSKNKLWNSLPLGKYFFKNLYVKYIKLVRHKIRGHSICCIYIKD